MTDYYNTNQEEGQALTDSENRARSQQDYLLGIFRSSPGAAFGPSELLAYFPHGTPLTSVRRAITNLTNQGLLVKTDKMHIGPYGKSEHTWMLAEPKTEKTLFD